MQKAEHLGVIWVKREPDTAQIHTNIWEKVTAEEDGQTFGLSLRQGSNFWELCHGSLGVLLFGPKVSQSSTPGGNHSGSSQNTDNFI